MLMENKCRWKSFCFVFCFFLRVLQVNTKHTGEYFYVSSLGNPQTADYQASRGRVLLLKLLSIQADKWKVGGKRDI